MSTISTNSSNNSSSVLDTISHYQRKIERATENGRDNKKLLRYIEKLFNLPINVELLQETGIGKTINGLRKYDSEVGESAKALVNKWKATVAEEEFEQHKLRKENNGGKSDDDNFDNDDNFIPDPRIEHFLRKARNKARLDAEDKAARKLAKGKKNSSRRKKTKSKKRTNLLSEPFVSQNENINFAALDFEIEYTTEDERNFTRIEEARAAEAKKKYVNNIDDRKLKIPKGLEKTFTSSEITDLPIKHVGDLLNTNSTETFKELPNELPKDSLTEVSNESPKESSKESSKESPKHTPKELPSINKDQKSSSSKCKSVSPAAEKSKKEDKKSSNDKKRSSDKKSSTDKKEKLNTRHNSEDNASNDKKNYSDKRVHCNSSKTRGESKEKSRDRKSETRHEIEKYNKSDIDKKYSDNNKHDSHSDKSKETKHHKSKNEEINTKKRRLSISEDNSNNKSKTKAPKLVEEMEIDSTTGTSFEDALGMMMPAQKNKNACKSSPISISYKSSPQKSSMNKITSSPESSNGSNSDAWKFISNKNIELLNEMDTKSQTSLLTTTTDLRPFEMNISSDLSNAPISNNYKPMPLNPTVMECIFKPATTSIVRSKYTDDEALQHGISSKTIRTKVYSGIKTGKVFHPLTLLNMCTRVLQRNIDCLEYTGGVPFDILKPILERASPIQLSIIEEYNPYLLEDSDCLWKHLALRHYRSDKRQEMESFREMFFRCKEQQEFRLDALTKKVKNSQTVVALPVRKTQLAYIDSMVKPPRNVLRKQEQFGTSKKLVATPAARVPALNNVTPNATKIGDVRLRVAAHEKDKDTAQAGMYHRPKKAPLMAKSLLLLKGRRR